MRTTAILISLTSLLTVLFLASAAQSEKVAHPEDFIVAPTSYYLFGEMYQHPESKDDAFGRWWNYKRELSSVSFSAEYAQPALAGKVSNHFDSWNGFRDFRVIPADAGRGGNVITVPPTYDNITQMPPTLTLRREASLNTLDMLQEAIDEAPNNATIQLTEGYYDLSAVLDAFGAASCEYNFYNGMELPFCQKNGPHSLMSQFGATDVPAAYGVVVLDKKKLIIAGTTDANGMPLTVLMGNPMAMMAGPTNTYQYNVGFSVGGGSNHVTITGIEFRDFAYPIRVLDHCSIPTPMGMMFSSDPAFDGGSHNTEITQNIFQQPLIAVSVEGRHVLPSIRTNVINMGPNSAIRAAINIYSGPDKIMENPRIIGNLVSGFGGFTGVNVAWSFITNGWIKENEFLGGAFGIQMLGASDWQITDNLFSANSLGGIFLKSNIYSVQAPTGIKQYLQRSSENLIAANTFQGVLGNSITLWGATLNTVKNNQVQGGAMGILLFVDISYVGMAFPIDVHYIPADYNLIEENNIAGCVIPVSLANYARYNNLIDNSITLAGFGSGYIISGLLNTGGVSLGRASGNFILDPNLATNPLLVADLSFCNQINGITFCDQIDYDNDGQINEDDINGLNDDGDFIFGYPGIPQYLFDEDAPDDPNVYVATEPNKDLIADDDFAGIAENADPEMICHPNPVENNAIVTVTLKEDTHVTLNLYDEQGREVLNLEDQFRSTGIYNYNIVRRDLSPGMYFLKLTTHSEVLTQKVILGR